MDKLKQEIIEIGKWIWEKDLTGALSGNISVKVSSDEILITASGACLGKLKESDISMVDSEGKSKDAGFVPSVETALHVNVYKELDAKAIVHVHPVFCNGYFEANDSLQMDIFETRLTLGDVPVLEQNTPAITEIEKVTEAFKRSNIVVLKHHGVAALGDDLRQAFFLIQTLEEAVKIACIKRMFSASSRDAQKTSSREAGSAVSKKYKLFSEDQIKDIVSLVNADEKFYKLAKDSSLETKLAVVLDESGLSYCFHFSGGKISGYSNSTADAEFIISGKAEYWKAIFCRQLDPFAATTQKKLKLKGDFAKISRWYVPFNRLFELWVNVPVE